MKCLTLFSLLLLWYVPFAQNITNYQKAIVEDVQDKVCEIDSQIKYKSIYNFYGYESEISEIHESWAELYFNTSKELSKVKLNFYLEGKGSRTYYFMDGKLIYANFIDEYPGEEIFASKYLTDIETPLCISYMRDIEEMLVEYSIKYFLFDTEISIPTTYGEEYDNINNLVLLRNALRIDTITFPEKESLEIKLAPSVSGDTTSILFNNAPIHSIPSSSDSEVLASLKVGDVSVIKGKTRFNNGSLVVVLENTNELWSKVKAIDLIHGNPHKEYEGYIQVKDLIPQVIKQSNKNTEEY